VISLVLAFLASSPAATPAPQRATRVAHWSHVRRVAQASPGPSPSAPGTSAPNASSSAAPVPGANATSRATTAPTTAAPQVQSSGRPAAGASPSAAGSLSPNSGASAAPNARATGSSGSNRATGTSGANATNGGGSATQSGSGATTGTSVNRGGISADTGFPLILPRVPSVEPGFRAPSIAFPSGDIAGNDGPFVGLALDRAIGMALARNPDLAVSQSNRRVAAYQIQAARGAYDLRLEVQPAYTSSQSPSVSSFQSGPGGSPIKSSSFGASGGVSGLTGSGGSFRATTSADRNTNNSTLNSYDPYYTTSLGIELTQPLARGRAIDATRRAIALSKIDANLTDDTALLTASNTVNATLVAYYNLVAAWKNVAIQEQALRAARLQSLSNQRLSRQGSAARIDIIESDTQVNDFQDNVYTAIANVASLQNTLKSLILGDPADPIWTANLVPTSPISTIVAEPALGDVVVAALRSRPEVAQLRENFRAQDVNVAYASDQRKPQIDLNLGVTENGFAGRPTDPNANPFVSGSTAQVGAINALIARANASAPPGAAPLQPIPPGSNALYPGTVGGFGTSYNSLFRGQYPTYTVGATISLPLRNRTANANYAAEVERRQSLVAQEVGLVQRVQFEARNAIQQYRSARSRLIAASAARVAAESVEASERRKFRAGQSTTFLVLQRQVTVANERGRELQAQSDVQKALVEIDRVTGAILANNGVDVTKLGTTPLGRVPDLRLTRP